jgi:hypothetical protein
MRIPPSVIVMSLLTAVPFGLAIRDAKRGPAHPHDDWQASDDDDIAAAEKRRQRELDEMKAQEAEQEAAHTAKRLDIAHKIVGAEPASFGPLLAGVHLGASASDFQPEDVRRALADASDVLSVEWDVDSAHLNGVTLQLKDDCAPLVAATEAWGAGNGGVWENPATHQRARLDLDACSLQFERYADLDHWLDRGDGSIVPMSAVGQPPDKLHARVAGAIERDDDDGFEWHDLGPAGTFGSVHLTATIEHGKIVQITAEPPPSSPIDAIAVRVSKLVGTPGKHDDDALSTQWKSKPPILLRENIPSLTIGSLP